MGSNAAGRRPESIIEAIEQYVSACPLLKDGAMRVDALGDEATEYVIEPGIYDPVIERYIDGSSDRRCQFVFGSREAYGMDRVQNMMNSAFYERFADWIEERSKAGDLPDLPDGRTPETIAATSPGYLLSEDGKTARYQIQIEMTYHQRA